METSRGISPRSTSSSAGQLMLVMLVTIICSSAVVDAYVASPSPSLPSVSSTRISNTASRIILNGIGCTNGSCGTSRSSRPQSLRLYSSDPDNSDSTAIAKDAIANVTGSATQSPGAQFGDVMPMQRKSPSASSAQFGDVVSISRPSSATSSSPSLFEEAATPKTITSKSSGISDVERLKQRRQRNLVVAIISVFLAVGNYAYEWTHPATPIQILVKMEKNSASLADVGKNSKPTVIDFWAPWCENCRYMAPTLFQIEESYKDKVNFVMVNGDDPNNWPLIEALGVDAIPHLSLLEADGTVDTALIGTVPKEWLTKDIDVLLENASKNTAITAREDEQAPRRKLPFQMLDVFANRPEARKIVNLDAVVEAGRR